MLQGQIDPQIGSPRIAQAAEGLAHAHSRGLIHRYGPVAVTGWTLWTGGAVLVLLGIPDLAASPWAGNHRNSYAQASSPFPGPTGPAEHVNVDHDGFAAAPIVLSFSPEYRDGGRVIWASTVGLTNEILKIDPETVTVIDKYIPQVEEGAGPGTHSVSGAYNLVDADNRLHVGRARALDRGHAVVSTDTATVSSSATRICTVSSSSSSAPEAVAAAIAGTDDPAAVAAEINGVTRDGETCETFADCIALIDAGTDIDYDGPSGPQTFGPEGEPTEASFKILSYDADNMVEAGVPTEFRFAQI